MTRRTGRAILGLLLALTSGCGTGPAPRLDATDDRTAFTSIAAMTAGMSSRARDKFLRQCESLTGTALPGAWFDGTPPIEKTIRADRLRALHGMTVAEIAAKDDAKRRPEAAILRDAVPRLAAGLLYAVVAIALVRWLNRRHKAAKGVDDGVHPLDRESDVI